MSKAKIQSRKKAKEIGAIPIDFSKGDPVEQIKDLRRNNKALQQSFRPGEEKMSGVNCALDAVGYPAHTNNSTSEAKGTAPIGRRSY